MNAEDRKTVEENTLVHGLKGAYAGLKQGPSRSTLYYVLAVAAVVGVVLLFRYFYRQSEEAASNRWVELDQVVFQEQLDQFVEKATTGDLKDTPQGRLGLFKEARRLLSQGLQDLGTAPAEAKKNLEKALEMYDSLARDKMLARTPLLHQEALSSSARAAESLGNVEDAVERYELLVKEYPQSALGKDAASHAKRLKSEEGERAATQLAKTLGLK